MPMLPIAVFCVFWLVPIAQHERTVSNVDLNLRSFLLAVYPELSGRALEIQRTKTRDVVGIVVSEVAQVTGRLAPSQTRLLTARVELTSEHEVRSFDARGPFLSDKDNAALAGAVRSAVAVGLNADGVLAGKALRFGADRRAAVQARLAQLQLDARFGQTQIVSTTAIAGPSDSRYGFVWIIDILGARPGETAKHYLLTLEPFNGRVVGLREK